MSVTSHGHHIPGTDAADFQPAIVTNCGGVESCLRCRGEMESSMAYRVGEHTDYQAKAKRMIREHVNSAYANQVNGPIKVLPEDYTVYIVWFAKTLQNWKGCLSTTIPDNMYYEITYDGDNRKAYIDSYLKVDQTIVQG